MQAEKLHARLTELCYRRSCDGGQSSSPPLPALWALRAAWTTLGDCPSPAAPTPILLASTSLDELRLCNRLAIIEQQHLHFVAVLGRVSPKP
jgi:hypothetical protein